MIYVTGLARLTIVKVKKKSPFDYKIGVEAQEYIYVEGNTTRAFLLKLLVSQIRLLLIYGASQTAQSRRVCNISPLRFLFSKLEGILKGTRFQGVEDIKTSVTRHLKTITKKEFSQCFKAWSKRMNGKVHQSQWGIFRRGQVEMI